MLYRVTLFFLIPLLLQIMNVYSSDLPLKGRGTTYDFVAYTVPKSGSHLLHCTLKLLTDRSRFFYSPDDRPNSVEETLQRMNYLNSIGKFEMSHLPFSKKEANYRITLNCKIFTTIRDPRDTLISYVDYVDQGYGMGITGEVRERWNQMTRDEKIIWALETAKGGHRKRFEERLPWGKTPISCIVRFENLVGEKGGGTEEAQQHEIKKIANHIGLDATDEELAEVGKNLFGWGPTFNVGKVSRWKDEFNQSHIERFKELMGDILINLGYEDDYDW